MVAIELSFGAQLRQYRELAGLTQEELAAKAGRAPKAIGAFERGVRPRRNPHTLRALGAALQLSSEQYDLLLRLARGTQPARDRGAGARARPQLTLRSLWSRVPARSTTRINSYAHPWIHA